MTRSTLYLHFACRLIRIIATSLLFTSRTVVTQNYDCRTGCSLDANIMGPPVCGIDHLTYLNECLAVCQNVVVVQYGPCDDDSSIAEDELSTDPEVVTMEIMTRFLSRGYRFVAKNTHFVNQPDNREEATVTVAGEPESARVSAVEEEDEVEPYFVLFTPDGYEYAYRAAESIPSYPGPTPQYTGMQQLRRHLAVIGDDTRTRIADTKAFPFRTIGEADFGNLEGGCTLTMISRNAALTAGHCVYSVKNKKPINMSRIAPGRYRESSTGRTVAPFGTWNVETMQTFGQFKTNGDMTYDIAVVTFQAATRSDMQNCPYVYPGDLVGFLGIDRARTSGGRISDSRLASSTITGYPADFKDGEMVTSGTCSRSWESDHTQFAYHFCDTFGGNSGSAVLTSSNIILGEHAYGFYNAQNVAEKNGAVMMTGQVYDSVYEWAGLGVNQEACGFITGPQPSADCACRNLQERPFVQVVCFLLNRQQCFGRS